MSKPCNWICHHFQRKLYYINSLLRIQYPSSRELHQYVSSIRHFYILASMHPTIASMFGDSEQSNIQINGMVSTKTIHNITHSTFVSGT